MENKEPTCTIGSQGVVITYDTHTLVIPWRKVKIKTEDIAKAIEQETYTRIPA